MTELIAIAFPEKHDAEELLLRLRKLDKDYLVDLDDACVVVRRDDGTVKLYQSQSLTAEGAVTGGFWGLLIGVLFLNPILGAAVGTGIGAVSGALTDVGIDDRFMKELGEALVPGSSALFVLITRAPTDKVLSRLEGAGGTVFHTSLSSEAQERLQAALTGPSAGSQAELEFSTKGKENESTD